MRFAPRLLAVAALVGALALSGVAPAHAAPPTGGITSPAADAELTEASDAVVSILFSAPSGGQITNAALALQSIRAGRSQNLSFADVNQSSFSYTWSSFEPGLLDFNGEYRIRAEATATDGALDTNGPETTVRTRSFYLAVPPVAPDGVTARFNAEARTVAVSWTGNPEPDLLGYIVQRKAGGGSFSNLAEIEPSQTSYTDDASEFDGDYSYRVVALREGAEDLNANPSEAYEALNSDPSSASTVTIAAAATPSESTSSTQQSGGTQEPSATTSTSEQPAFDQQGRVDLSGFASLLDQARARPQPRPTTPDPGFSEALPYGARPPGSSAAPTTAGNADVEIALADDDTELGDGERLRSMAFLAGGLFSFVLLMHLVWIRGEVKHAPLPADEPGDVEGDDGETQSDDHTGPDGGAGAGTLGSIPDEPVPVTPAPRKRSQGARGAAHRVPPRSRGDRREGRPAVRAGR